MKKKYNRRAFIGLCASTFLLLKTIKISDAMANHKQITPIIRSNNEWKALLTPEEFDILRDDGTERSFSSPLNDEKRKGQFICKACKLPLFESTTKYDSGTGWPSFYQPIEGHVETKRDFKLLYPRTEYHCARCNGHQGHVFKDGPKPTGLRYCNNGLALEFIPEANE